MAVNAPPQQQAEANDETALVASPIIEIKAIAGRAEVERIETVVAVPPGFQYVIPGREPKVGMLSDGYDYINRVLGATFYMPDWVPDENGELARNPIHRKNGYILLALVGVWYNEAGQMVSATELIEIDPEWIRVQARAAQWGSVVVTDATTGQPKLDENGMPEYVFTGTKDEIAKAEKKAMDAYIAARTFGIRKAQTVARRRLLAQATGIKSLPGSVRKTVQIRVVGYRDALDPKARIAATTGAIFGEGSKTPEDSFTKVTAEDMAAIDAEGVGDQELDVDGGLAADDRDDSDPGPGNASIEEFALPQ